MNRIFRAIKSSYFKSLKGEENFWVVLLGWGVGVYVLSISIGFSVFPVLKFLSLELSANLSSEVILKIAQDLIFMPVGMIGALGMILIFVYPFLFVFSLVKCASNCSLVYLIFSILLSLIFSALHYVWSYYLTFFGSLMFILASKSGAVFIFGIAVYILIKTAKTLLTTNAHQ